MHTKSRIAVIALASPLFLAPALAQAQQDEKDLLIEQQKKTIERLKKEIELQNKVIREREAAIIKLEADVKKHRIDGVQFEALARVRQIQNEALVECIRELIVGRKEPGAGRIENPNEPNPPNVKVNGKIEKLDGDLMQINLGTDHGVNKDHTLEVYRLKPEPKYLGMIRIVDAGPNQSVGRLISVGKKESRPMLKVGDLITSKLTDDGPKKDKSDLTKEKEKNNKK